MAWAGNLSLLLFFFAGAFYALRLKWQHANQGAVCALSMAVSVMALYPLLLAGAMFGFYGALFSPALQVVFAILFLVMLALILRKKQLSGITIDRWELIFYLAAIALLVLNILFAQTTLLGGRDEGVYFNSAVSIAKTGNLIPQALPSAYYFTERGLAYPGIYADGATPIVQFSNVFPLILSYFYRCFGLRGITLASPLLSFFGSVMFFQLLKRLVGKPIAAIFSVMFCWNILQIWFSRITLTEIITQLFILCALYLTILLSERPTARLAVFAGAMWGFTAFIRNDALLLLTVVAVICAYLLLTEDSAVNRRKVYLLGAVSAVMFTLAFFTYPFFTYYYYYDLSGEMDMLILAGLAAMALCLAIGSLPMLRKRIRPVLRAAYVLVFIALVAGFLFVSDIRPYFPLADNILFGGNISEQTQNTFPRLQMYLGIGVMVAALFGALIMARRSFVSLLRPHFIVLSTVGSFTALYLMDMRISPDLHWSMRRFMPVVVPGLILAAAVLVSYLIEHRRISARVGLLAAVVLMAVNGMKTYNVLAYSDRQGEVASIALLEAALPEDGLIFTDNQRVGTALYMAYQRPVYALQNMQAPIAESLYYLLVSPDWAEQNQPSGEVLGHFTIESLIKERLVTGMPLNEVPENSELILIRMTS